MDKQKPKQEIKELPTANIETVNTKTMNLDAIIFVWFNSLEHTNNSLQSSCGCLKMNKAIIAPISAMIYSKITWKVLTLTTHAHNR